MEQELIAAQAAADRQDYPLALRQLQDYLRHAKHDGRGWELFGLVLSARGNHSASVSALEHASLLVPLRPAARVCLGVGYGTIGRTALSRELLEVLIGDKSLSPELLLQVAQGLNAVDATELALQACRTAAALDPLLPQPYYDLGYYSALCGRPPEITVALARKAISLDPGNVCYRIGLASLLVKLSRSGDAYQVVQHLTNDDIELIGCTCCLERIVPLFETHRDFRRAVLCRRRLLQLAATNPATQSKEAG